MNFQVFATVVLIGLLTGWLAGFVMKNGGHGLLWDLIVGLVGSTGAGEVLFLLGLAADGRIFVPAVVAFVGAAAVLIAQRQVWPAHA
jgi:uncharacterized membrane protein YeaQ/YmgE (transglycosylase-associated protein family)